jgi:NAD(P)H-nitrite reductase large subunit
LFSVGDFLGDESCESIHFTDPALGIYKKLVIKDNKLIGAVLYGDTADGNWYQELLEKEEPVSGIRDALIFGFLVNSVMSIVRGGAAQKKRRSNFAPPVFSLP